MHAIFFAPRTKFIVYIRNFAQNLHEMKRKLFLVLYYGLAYHLPNSYVPVVGKFSNALRVLCCHHIFRKCGKIVTINRHAYFGNGRDVEIGDNSGLGANNHLPNNIIIGDDVMMAPDILIFKENHRYADLDKPIGKQGMAPAPPVVLGNDLWIGQRVIITPGRHIADGTVVAAGAVVTKDLPPFSVIGGNPARVIKSRKDG